MDLKNLHFPPNFPQIPTKYCAKMSVFGKCTEKVLFSPKFAPIPPNFCPKCPNIGRGKRRILTIPTQKKKIFFIILKNDIFAPFRPIFAQFPPHWSASVKKSEVSLLGFVAPKSPFFRPISSLCLQPKRRSVGKKEVRFLGEKHQKTSFSQKGSRRGFFWG